MKRKLLIALCLCGFAVLAAAPAFGIVPPPPQKTAVTLAPENAPHPQSQTGVTWLTLATILVLVSANVSIVTVVLFRGTRHKEVPASLEEWDSADYWRALPNVLARLNQRRFTSAWPARGTQRAARRFESRLRGVLQPLLHQQTSHFVRQHLAVWAWVQSHHEAFDQFLTVQQIERALERLAVTSDRIERATLIAFLNRARRTDLSALADTKTREQLHRLERLQAIVREHGYSLTSKFDDAEQLAQTPPENILHLLSSTEFSCAPHRRAAT